MNRAVGEFLGTFSLLFAGTGAIIVNDTYGGVIGHAGIALSFGLIVMTMIYAIGDVSGAHLNPAVTVGFWLSRRLPLRDVGPYVLSQVLGALMVEIASDLERIGEHAKKVARANSLTLEHHYRRPFMSIQRMAVAVQSMLNQALVALDHRDSRGVERVFQALPQAEDLYQRTYQDLLSVTDIRPGSANQAIYLSRAAYDLKRAAERVAGICEWVMFTLTGTMEETQRHHGKLTVKNGLYHQDCVTV